MAGKGVRKRMRSGVLAVLLSATMVFGFASATAVPVAADIPEETGADLPEEEATESSEVNTTAVTVHVTDEQGAALSGAALFIEGGPEDEDGLPSTFTWITAEDPYVLALEPGEYVLIEQEAAEGYQKASTPIVFAITNEGKVILEEHVLDNGAQIRLSEDGQFQLINIPEERVPMLRTHVTAGTSEGSETAPAQVSYEVIREGAPIPVFDTVVYSGLIEGVTYTVTGTLIEVGEDGEILDASVAETTQEYLAEADGGTWIVDFGGLNLQAAKTYVVFEQAYAEGEEDKKATREQPLLHNDPHNLAQSIKTEFGEEPGEVLDTSEDPIEEAEEVPSGETAEEPAGNNPEGPTGPAADGGEKKEQLAGSQESAAPSQARFTEDTPVRVVSASGNSAAYRSNAATSSKNSAGTATRTIASPVNTADGSNTSRWIFSLLGAVALTGLFAERRYRAKDV